jgi:ligand-binding sensor domain-containing protein
MKKHFANLQNFTLLLFIFVTSCSGQINTKIQAKIPKSQNKQTGIGAGIQDKNGNIWFGSSNMGIYRYDGTNFISFSE